MSKQANIIIEGNTPNRTLKSGNQSLSSSKLVENAKIVERILTAPFRHFPRVRISWKFIKLLISLGALYFLFHLDSQAQTYQEYPISPTIRAKAPKPLSAQDSAVIKSKAPIMRCSVSQKGNKVVSDAFLEGATINSCYRFGNYWKVVSSLNNWKEVHYFKTSTHNLGWIRGGMRTTHTASYKREMAAGDQLLKAHTDKAISYYKSNAGSNVQLAKKRNH